MTKKAPSAYKTIGEVAELLGLPTHVLRFWESKFPSLIKPTKCNSRRLYDLATVEKLTEIKDLLHNQGLTIKGAQRYFEAKKSSDPLPSAITINPNPAEQPVATTESLEAVKHSLDELIVERQDVERLHAIHQQLSDYQQKLKSLIAQHEDVGA